MLHFETASDAACQKSERILHAATAMIDISDGLIIDLRGFVRRAASAHDSA